MGDSRDPYSGFLPEERPASLPSPTCLSSITLERWAIAEKATNKIIYKVLPTAVSEERRREVIGYVCRLIRTRIGREVFPYGSVPLKTYLPDGDIDLTVFGGASSEYMLADDIVSVIEREDRNGDTEFIMKDVELIRAEVKLVKCVVQNIVVDISLNQIGGLCTLCFLEQVDRLIGKDHLFKRSIILIKAWCYYESRILGAHHGLISTYALETLVLYIFHLFHTTLEGPLAVLYKFLEYFSKFDWENYCISLNGPVCLASLPELMVEMPENGGGDLLLSNEFLRHCIDMFSVPSRGFDSNPRTFQQKHLNIVDPLKENNNLGRSVSKGNFYRIRSAFAYGARKLGRILMQPEYDINEELKIFFANTLDRHGSGQRPDVRGPFPVHCCGVSVSPQMLLSHNEASPTQISIPESKSVVYTGTMDDCSSDQNESSTDGINEASASTISVKYSNENRHHDGSVQLLPSGSLHEADCLTMGNVLDHQMRVVGDALDLATYKSERLKISSEEENADLAGEESVSPVGVPFHAHNLYFVNSLGYCKSRSAKLDSVQSQKLEKNTYVGESCASSRVNGEGLENDDVDKGEALAYGGLESAHPATKTVVDSGNQHHITWDWSLASEVSPESSETMSDLTGDYDTHFSSLLYGRWCFEYASGVPAIPSLSPAVFQFKNPRAAAQPSSLLKANGFSHSSANGVIPSSPFYTVNPMPGMSLGLEEMRKPRGTGTYFPNPVQNRPAQGFRPTLKGRYITSSRSPGTGRSVMALGLNMFDHSSRKASQSAELVDQSTVPSDHLQAVSLLAKRHSTSNVLAVRSDSNLESGSVGPVSIEAPVLERSRQWQRKEFTSESQNSPTDKVQRLKTVLDEDHDRVSMKSTYHLKDEDDFPPLSV